MIEDLRFNLAFGLFLGFMGAACCIARAGFWIANKVDAA